MRRAELLARIVEEQPDKPSVRSTGIAVLGILERISHGVSEDEILKQSPGLEGEDLRACAAYAAELAPGSRAPELEELIARRFPAEGHEDRVRRALEAFKRFRTEFSFNLDLETVKWIAQDPDIMDI